MPVKKRLQMRPITSGPRKTEPVSGKIGMVTLVEPAQIELALRSRKSAHFLQRTAKHDPDAAAIMDSFI